MKAFRLNYNYGCDEFTEKELEQLQSEILPDFLCSFELLKNLAYLKRKLHRIALNTEEEYTKIEAIKLQDIIDMLASEYILNCLDNYIFG